jgi:hypothetical protein
MTSLPPNFPDDCVFIIDGLTSAFLAALVAQRRPMRCIYECKRVEWRQVDFVALYDLLLSDQQVVERRIAEVPHPYLFESGGVLDVVRWQRRFIRDVMAQHPLDPATTYVGSVTSSLLLANKQRVRHVLMDEGMDSLMTRHRLYSQKPNGLRDRLRGLIANRLFPFRFDPATPQITMAGDEHPAIVLRADYRKFRSRGFDAVVAPLLRRLEQNRPHVLVLLKGPPLLSANAFPQDEAGYSKHIAYNRDRILDVMRRAGLPRDSVLHLKAHPMLGRNSALVKGLVAALSRESLVASDLYEGLEFQELPSIPAEAFLATGKFSHVLSADASSTLWHVGHDPGLSCYLPVNALIDFTRETESDALLRLYRAQPELNRLNGNHVNCY